MSSRPFFNKLCVELEELFSRNAKDVKQLEQLAYELSFRTSIRSNDLRRRIDDALSEIATNFVKDEIAVDNVKVNDAMPDAVFSLGIKVPPFDESQLELGLSDPIIPFLAKVSPMNVDNESPEVVESLKSLLQFVQAQSKLRGKIVTDYNQHKDFTYSLSEFEKLPAIRINLDSELGEPIIIIPRLTQTKPPPFEVEFADWVKISDDIAKKPELRSSILVLKVEDGEDKAEMLELEGHSQEIEIRALFEFYISNKWLPWAAQEKPRRETIRIYGTLFKKEIELRGEILAENKEIVLGIGLTDGKNGEGVFRYPLITRQVELRVSEISNTIEIYLRDVAPFIELDIYSQDSNPNVNKVKDFFRNFIENEDNLTTQNPSEFVDVLRTAAAYLAPDGQYLPDCQSELTEAKESSLNISDEAILFVRPRNNHILNMDLDNFIAKLEAEGVCIPQAIKSVITEPKDNDGEFGGFEYRGISNSCENDGHRVKELYFPKPYNEEQIRIIELLDKHDGVVVEGPPGTGKTHTIANVISHYFALGKRVLVTSMKEPALSEVREKLPKEIRPLAISQLTNEQDGMRQFKESIEKISSEIQYLNSRELDNSIRQAQNEIEATHQTIIRIDRAINKLSTDYLSAISFNGVEISAQEAAKKCVAYEGDVSWFKDAILPENEILFSDVELEEIRSIRKKLGELINDVSCEEVYEFEPVDSRLILEIHSNLLNRHELNKKIENKILPKINAGLKIDDVVSSKIYELSQLRQELFAKYSRENCYMSAASVSNIEARQFKAGSDIEAFFEILEELKPELQNLLEQRTQFIRTPVSGLENLKLAVDLKPAIENLSIGKKPFGMLEQFSKKEEKSILGQVLIAGRKPTSTDKWDLVLRFIEHNEEIERLRLRWNSLVFSINLETINDANGALSMIDEAVKKIEMLKNVWDVGFRLIYLANSLFTETYSANSIDDATLSKIDFVSECYNKLFNLRNADEDLRYFSAEIAKVDLVKFKNYSASLSANVGNPLADQNEIVDAISQFNSYVAKIKSYIYDYDNLGILCEKIEKSGAKIWANSLLTIPAVSEIDPLCNPNWKEVWEVVSYGNYLDNLKNGKSLKDMATERQNSTKRLEKLYKDIIVNRSWLGVKNNATPSIKSALMAYRNAISKIGKTGKGKRANIARREAKSASTRVVNAIPCWIMPHWRVSESLPSDLGYFDLVIIDEASQSDLSAIPAILRANKILVVGDDKQISPDPVGIEIDKVQALKSQYLSKNIPEDFRNSIDPSRSVYDLFNVVYANSKVMLKEHFRCHSAIIEFSKANFYNHEIKPLRIPKPSERLSPPLIDVFIEHGSRSGNINVAECDFIISEIKKLANDPDFTNRTIGVVTLLGQDQWREIDSRIMDEIGVDAISKHKIICGDPYAFQGKEKDIMFISLVVDMNNNTAASGSRYDQRFNVAASRARDRMYLVRSVDLNDLSEKDTLRRSLLQHFRSPFKVSEIEITDHRKLCESPFEEEIYDILVECGYRVIPQVKIGRYRIDMVVEGENDKRIAIECDGDTYHGADKWDEDMARQRVLERAGFIFWRSFYSDFLRNRQEKIYELTDFLTSNEIYPIQSVNTFRHHFTELREINAFAEETNAIEQSGEINPFTP